MKLEVEISIRLNFANITNISCSGCLSPEFLITISKYLQRNLVLERKIFNGLYSLSEIDNPINKIIFAFENKEESFVLNKLAEIFSFKEIQITQGLEDFLIDTVEDNINNKERILDFDTKYRPSKKEFDLMEGSFEGLFNKGCIIDSKSLINLFNKSKNTYSHYVIDEAWNLFENKAKDSNVKNYLNNSDFLNEKKYRQLQKQTLLTKLNNKKEFSEPQFKGGNKLINCGFKPVKRRFH